MRFLSFALRIGSLSFLLFWMLGVVAAFNQPIRLPFVVDITTDTVDATVGDGICADANGDCSLRAAISEANETAEADIITLPAGEYILSILGIDDDLNLEGDLDIRTSLTIQGEDSTTTIIKFPTGNERILEIPAIATLMDVKIDRVSFIREPEDNFLGGIEVSNSGTTLHLTNSVIANFSQGLTIISATAIIEDSKFINTSRSGSLSRGITNTGKLSVYRSIFSQNTSSRGAGIYNSTTKSMLIMDSIFTDNVAEHGAAINTLGTAFIYNTVFTNNIASRYPQIHEGGAIYNTQGSLTIYNSTFNGNKADRGGAIYNNGDLNLYNTTLSGNSAFTGLFDEGGGIYNNWGTKLNLNNVTVTANNAREGGGLYILSSDSVEINIYNSIIAGNYAEVGVDCNDPGNKIVSGGNNLIGNTNNCLKFTELGDLVNVNASLDALNNNGGLTHTHALQSGSLAINVGNPATCIGYDQRYFPRVGTCDIGAYEADTPAATVTPTNTATEIAIPTETATDVPPTETDVLLTATATDMPPTETPVVPTGDTPTPTLDPETQVELLENGGFETLNVDEKPVIAPWVVKFGTSEKAKCNKQDKVIAHSGECAFMFKGAAGENSKLEQTITSDEDFAAGERLDFSAFVKGGNAPAVKVKVRVKYTDDSETGKINLNVTSGSDYVEITNDYALVSGAVNKIKVQFGNKSTSGKVYIDDVSLIYTSGAAGIIPLP